MRAFAYASLIAVGAIVPAPALAWPGRPTVNVPIAVGPLFQELNGALPRAAGGSQFIWTSGCSGCGRAAWVQRLDANGDPVWIPGGTPVTPVLPTVTNIAYADDGADGAYAVWQDAQAGATIDIAVQHVLPTGESDPHWPNGGLVICAAAGDQLYPQAVPDGEGGIIVCWQDQRSGVAAIYAQRVSMAGSPIWPSGGIPLAAGSGAQRDPQLVPTDAGGAVVAWVDEGNGTGQGAAGFIEWDLFMQRVDDDGSLLWTAGGMPVCTALGQQRYPYMAADGADGAFVVWTDARNPDDVEKEAPYAQHINSEGAASWVTNGVAMSSPANIVYHSPTSVTPDGTGGLVSVWASNIGRTGFGVYAQRVDRLGMVLWGSTGVGVSASHYWQELPRVIPSEMGDVIVGWMDFPTLGTSDMRAQRLNPAGGWVWDSAGVAVSTAPGYQGWYQVVPDGAGGAVFAWNDYRNGPDEDVYAQRVDKAGRLYAGVVGVAGGAAPATSELVSISPNPSHGAVWIDFGLHGDGHVRLSIVDLQGREIALLKDSQLSRGRHLVPWAAGRQYPPGVLFVVLRAGKQVVARPFVRFD